MPTIPSIRTSVENKALLVLDEHAKNGNFQTDARGRLIAYTGGFSVVFPYQTANGDKWAFRCWHSDIGNSRKRYEIISEAIKDAHLDFLCEFKYIEKGINVEGNIYPTTRMRWIDGVTIKDYICQNRNSKELLLALASNFLKMTYALHELSLAHGDLQHGNILVGDDHQLYLVDYDSFYCPKLEGEADTVTGLPDYQHPARKSNKSVSEKLDYFSELIIYLSILAIAESPSLIDKYQVADAERLLFVKEDFDNFKNSQIYKDISLLGNDFQEMLDVLEGYLECKSIDELMPFEVFRLDKRITFRTSATKAVRNSQAIVLDWSVPFEAEVFFVQKENGDIRKCENSGQLSLVLAEDSTFELSIRTNDGRKIRKDIMITVFDECTIDFKADKYYVFPSIPVVLSWKVTNAKALTLDAVPVEKEGKKVIEPTKATTCILSVEDEFGVKERRIDIHMLPVPQVKSLLVPTPDLNSNLSISILQPRYNTEVKFPQIDIGWINIEVPKVPSLTESGLFRKISPPLPKANLSLMSSIRRVFNHIIGK